MLLLVWGLGAWFCYDWKVGYPKKRDAAAAREALVAGFVKEGKTPDEAAAAAATAFVPIAQKNGWPEEKLDHDSAYYENAIKYEQPISAAVCGLAGLVMLYFYIRTSRGTLTADAVSFTTHWGKRVPFDRAHRIDRRKWDHKGLAYVHYKDDSGTERRAVIDDLIYGGAQKVLDRLMANFKGEIVDLEKPAEPAPEESDKPAAPEPPASQEP
jgi:hypothetical protein